MTLATTPTCPWGTRYKAHIPGGCIVQAYFIPEDKEVNREPFNNPTLLQEKYHLSTPWVVHGLALILSLKNPRRGAVICCSEHCHDPRQGITHIGGSMAPLE